MRKILVVLLIVSSIAKSQVVYEGKSNLIYSLPQTELVIHVTSELVTEIPGKFYQYSERYLAASEVITVEKQYYRIKSIHFETRTVPDPKRTFNISPSKKSVTNNITVNEAGLLCGVNVQPTSNYSSKGVMQSLEKENISQTIMPIGEDVLQAGSVMKMAEGVAKQIYRLRENREDILSGDVDYTPSDAVSLRAMLEEISNQEKALTELFVGITNTKLIDQTLIFKPTGAMNHQVLFRYSSLSGVIDHNDLSGDPYFINVSYTPIELVKADKKQKTAKETLYSVVPVLANIEINDFNDKQLYQQNISIPQLGVLMPIPIETMDKYSKAYVSPENGRLLSIEQVKK